MINLAALRYRSVLVADGGPVEQVVVRKFDVLAEPGYAANATLRADLMPGRTVQQLYGNASGSGTDRSPLVAQHKAISEAMERWAHWALHRSPEAARYGFDVDPSSTGMCAFPGLFARQARQGAAMEAAERFNMLHWWEGALDARPARSPWEDVEAWTVSSSAPGVTVLLHQRTKEGFHAYGHATAPDFRRACLHAAAEMERFVEVIRLHLQKGGSLTPAAGMPLVERRSLFFAGEEGHAAFRARLARTTTGPAPTPRLVFDGEVPGPWSRYADVWRVLFAPPSQRFLGREEEYFFW